MAAAVSLIPETAINVPNIFNPNESKFQNQTHFLVGTGSDTAGENATTATAYSLGQQLITTAFNIGFALVLICAVFGWQGGSKLVKDSYSDAKLKKDEMGAERKEKREAKREAKRTEARGGLMRVFRRGDETDEA